MNHSAHFLRMPTERILWDETELGRSLTQNVGGLQEDVRLVHDAGEEEGVLVEAEQQLRRHLLPRVGREVEPRLTVRRLQDVGHRSEVK